MRSKKEICLTILVLTILSLHFVSTVGSYTLSISHLPQFHKAEAFLIITDLSGTGPSINLHFYDEFGKEVSKLSKLLFPKGKINIEISEHLRSSGSIILESANEMIVAEYWLVNKDGTVSMTPLRPAIGNERYFANCLKVPMCEETIIAINDPKGNGPLVQIELYNVSGELVKIAKKMLRPYGTLLFKLSDYEPDNTTGKVSIRSFGGSICPYVIHTYKKKILLTFPMSAVSKNYVLNDVYVGNEVISSLSIMDVSSKENRIWISIYDNRGIKIAESIKILPPNSAIMIDLSDFIGNLNDGIIKITSDFDLMVDYWETRVKNYDIRIDSAIKNIGLLFKEALKKEDILLNSYYLYNKNIEFLITLVSTRSESMIVEIEFYADNGGKIGNKKLTLEPYKVFKEPIGRYFHNARFGTMIVKESSSNLLVSTTITNIKNDRILGKINSVAY